MPTFGLLPSDVVANSRGDVEGGVTLSLYATQADADASTGLLAAVTSDLLGRWTYTHATLGVVWVRTPPGVDLPFGAVYAVTSPEGLTGATGPTGSIGPIGPTGSIGPIGPTGATGAVGPYGGTAVADPAIAAIVGDPASATRTGLNSTFAPRGGTVYATDTTYAGGAKFDGITDDTAALQAFITDVVVNGRCGILPAGTAKITASLNVSRRPGWSLSGSGPVTTVIKMATDNVPILNMGSDAASFMHTWSITNIGFDYTNAQSGNTSATPILFSANGFHGVLRNLIFSGGYYGIKLATAIDSPWGCTFDDLTFGGNLYGGAIDWSLGTSGTPNNRFGRIFADCAHMTQTVFLLRGYNSVIDSIEMLNGTNVRLFHLMAGGQFAIGTMKLEIGSYTAAQSLFYFDNNSDATIGNISVAGTTMAIAPVSGAVYVMTVRAGARVKIGMIRADATSAASAYVADVVPPGELIIGRVMSSSGLWPVLPGWQLQNNGASSGGDMLTVENWVNRRVSSNKGDANYTVAIGDPNVVSFQTAFTAQRTITLPSDGVNMHNGLYYEMVFSGAINGTNTAVIKSGAVTLKTVTADSTVRYIWRRHPTATSGWVLC